MHDRHSNGPTRLRPAAKAELIGQFAGHHEIACKQLALCIVLLIMMRNYNDNKYLFHIFF